MKKAGITLTLGIVLVILGIFLGGLQYIDHFNHLSSYQWRSDEQNDLSYSSATSSSLDLRVHFADIKFYQTQEEKIRVEATHIYNGFQIYEENNTLIIEQPHYLWWNHPKTAYISIYVPESMELDEVDIDMSVGKSVLSCLKAQQVNIKTIAGEFDFNDIQCRSLDIDASMGQTTIDHLQFTRKMAIDLGMGDIYVLIDGYEEAYNYIVDVGLGSVSIGNQQFSGIVDQSNQSDSFLPLIDVDCGLGNIDIEMEEK